MLCQVRLFLFTLCTICATLFFGCHTVPCPPKEWVQSSDTVYDFFKDSLACGEFDHAYQILSPQTKQTLTYEEFYLVLTNFFLLKRVLTGAQKKTITLDATRRRGTLRIRHPELGVEATFRFLYFELREGKGYWMLDLTRRELEALAQEAQIWYQQHLAQLGERKYALPPWWRFQSIREVIELPLKREM